MKILIIGFSKIKYMPYINFCLSAMDRQKSDIHVIYWNRDLADEDVSALSGTTLHEFRKFQPDDAPKLSKLKSFRAFRKYASAVLDKVKPDRIVILHSLPGVLLSDRLTGEYSGRYIFDYRDYTYEGIPPYRQIIHRLVHCSFCTFVSSDGFRKYLPSDCPEKIHTSHNLLEASLEHRNERLLHGMPSEKIRVAFWGFIRHRDVNLEIIKKFAADRRFELHYYGREQEIAEELKSYVSRTGAENVFFHGEYRPEERYGFARNTDLIHNIYDDKNMMSAMGNKYYDGIIFGIPQICMRGSFMGERCTAAGVGFECCPYDADFTENVYNYYHGIDNASFVQACDREVGRVTEEYNDGKKCCSEFFEER